MYMSHDATDMKYDAESSLSGEHAIQSVPEDGADQSGPWSSPFLLRRRLLFHLLFVIIIDHRNMLRWL